MVKLNSNGEIDTLFGDNGVSSLTNCSHFHNPKRSFCHLLCSGKLQVLENDSPIRTYAWPLHCISPMELSVFLDTNSNGEFDTGELPLENIPISVPGSTFFSDSNGKVYLKHRHWHKNLHYRQMIHFGRLLTPAHIL